MTNFTKKEIKNTFLKMLEEMPLNQITVKELVRECGINRNSFYYHYQDIPALIEEIVTEDADEIIRTYGTIDSMQTGLKAILEFVSVKRKAILHIFNSVNRDIFERDLWKVCEYVVTQYLKPILSRENVSDFDQEIIFKFYKCECFGFAMEWLNNGMEEEAQAQIDRFCEYQTRLFEELLTLNR